MPWTFNARILDRPNRRQSAVFLVLLIALAVRLFALLLIPDQSAMFSDAPSYKLAGQVFWSSFSFGNIYIMPLYPMIAGALGSLHVLFDILLSVVSVRLVYTIAKEVFADDLIALLSAFIVAVYPPLIFFSVLGLSETLFITLLLAAFACWYRGSFALAAIFAALSILTRPVLDLAAPFLVVYFSVIIHRLEWRGAFRNLAVYGLIYAALMSPWWVYNYQTYGTFVRLNLNFGITLYAGNNPMNKTGGGNGHIDWDVDDILTTVSDPIEQDKIYKQRAYSYIAGNPLHFVEMALLKIGRMWRPWPSFTEYAKPVLIIGSIVTYGSIYILSLIYLAMWGWSEIRRTLPMLFMAAYLTTVVTVLFGTIRYRLPLEPFMIMLTAATLVRLARRWQIIGRATA